MRSEDNLSTVKRPDEKHTRRGRSSACRRNCAARSRRSLYIAHSRNSGSSQVDSQRQLKVRFANLFSGKRGYRAEDIACLLSSCAHNALVMDWCSAPPWRRRRRRHAICITSGESADYESSPVIECPMKIHVTHVIKLARCFFWVNESYT